MARVQAAGACVRGASGGMGGGLHYSLNS
jgi:hypothetical protein